MSNVLKPTDLTFTMNVNGTTLDFDFPRFTVAATAPLHQFVPYTAERINALDPVDRDNLINALNTGNETQDITIPTINHQQYEQPLLRCFNSTVSQTFEVNNQELAMVKTVPLFGGHAIPFSDLIAASGDETDNGLVGFYPMMTPEIIDDYINEEGDSEPFEYFFSDDELVSIISYGDIPEEDAHLLTYSVTTLYSDGLVEDYHQYTANHARTQQEG